MKNFRINPEEANQTLEKYVRKILPLAPLSFIYKQFRKKDVKVNGHWEDMKYCIKENDEVSLYITDALYEEFTVNNTYSKNDRVSSMVIFEDKNVLILNKPRGILVQQDASKEKALDQMVVEYLMFKGEYDPNKNKGFKPGPVHRIDRNTSGIVIFGKNRDTLAYLSDLIKNHIKIKKKYLSLVVGEDIEDGFIEAPLRKNFSTKKVVVCKEKDGGKYAKTIYKVKEKYNGYTLLELTLVTGRTHQIRVHMSYLRHHVAGDSKYGDFKANNQLQKLYGFKDQFLHANEIEFEELEGHLKYLSNKKFLADMPKEFVNLLNNLKN